MKTLTDYKIGGASEKSVRYRNIALNGQWEIADLKKDDKGLYFMAKSPIKKVYL